MLDLKPFVFANFQLIELKGQRSFFISIPSPAQEESATSTNRKNYYNLFVLHLNTTPPPKLALASFWLQVHYSYQLHTAALPGA